MVREVRRAEGTEADLEVQGGDCQEARVPQDGARRPQLSAWEGHRRPASAGACATGEAGQGWAGPGCRRGLCLLPHPSTGTLEGSGGSRRTDGGRAAASARLGGSHRRGRTPGRQGRQCRPLLEAPGWRPLPTPAPGWSEHLDREGTSWTGRGTRSNSGQSSFPKPGTSWDQRR